MKLSLVLAQYLLTNMLKLTFKFIFYFSKYWLSQ